MSDSLHNVSSEFNKVIDYLRSDISSLRTGRANPAILENVTVEAYGARSPLATVAGITVPDPRTILVEPWDKSLVKAIEKGIIEADLGINPAVSGTQIRVVIPAPTEESRKKLVKLLGERLEHARTGIRRVRDEARGEIKAQQDTSMSEDEKYKLLEQLDKSAAGANERIKHIGEEKEKEIMTI